MSIASVSPAGALSSIAASARAPAAKPASANSSTTSTTQEKAALNQALGKYKTDLSQGQPASALKSLARQIAADAKALGQNVQLPTAPAAAASAPAKPEVSSASTGNGRLDTVA